MQLTPHLPLWKFFTDVTPAPDYDLPEAQDPLCL